MGEHNRVDVVVYDEGDGWLAEWYEVYNRDAAEEFLSGVMDEGCVGAIVGFDFTPFEEDFGWAYGTNGDLLPEKAEELLREWGESSGDIVSDAVENRMDDLIADAKTQIGMGV